MASFLSFWKQRKSNEDTLDHASLGHLNVVDGLNDLTALVEKDKERLCVSGFGGFADVWKGTFKLAQDDHKKDHTRQRRVAVAIKALRVYSNDSDFDKKVKHLKRELKVWKRLSHPHVVPLYGISHPFGPLPAMICPWMSGGTLNDFLKSERAISNVDRWKMVYEILRGLVYLHDLSVVHGDLSGANVLLDHKSTCYLTDFGLSAVLSDLEESCFVTSSNHGAVRWAPPETYSLDLPTSRKTMAGDAYSFGSLMLQVLTRKLPWSQFHNANMVMVALISGETPARPKESIVSDDLWRIMQACWLARPPERPTSRQVHMALADLVPDPVLPALQHDIAQSEGVAASLSRVDALDARRSRYSLLGPVTPAMNIPRSLPSSAPGSLPGSPEYVMVAAPSPTRPLSRADVILEDAVLAVPSSPLHDGYVIADAIPEETSNA